MTAALSAVAGAEPAPATTATTAVPWTACGAACERQDRGCTFGCDDSRGCMRICSSRAIDCRAGCALGMTPEAVAVMWAWIEGPLAGNDNSKAKLQLALIERNLDTGSDGTPAGYEAYIKNVLGVRCALTWDRDGRPASLKACKASEREWAVTPTEIPLQCAVDVAKKREKCIGNYHQKVGKREEKGTLTLLRVVK